MWSDSSGISWHQGQRVGLWGAALVSVEGLQKWKSWVLLLALKHWCHNELYHVHAGDLIALLCVPMF